MPALGPASLYATEALPTSSTLFASELATLDQASLALLSLLALHAAPLPVVLSYVQASPPPISLGSEPTEEWDSWSASALSRVQQSAAADGVFSALDMEALAPGPLPAGDLPANPLTQQQKLQAAAEATLPDDVPWTALLLADSFPLHASPQMVMGVLRRRPEIRAQLTALEAGTTPATAGVANAEGEAPGEGVVESALLARIVRLPPTSS